MARVKPVRRPLLREVIYSEERFQILRTLRSEAIKVMSSLEAEGILSFLHGSVARGDVNARSDIDIITMDVVPSYKVELALSKIGYEPQARFIVMATPSHAMKATTHLKNNIIVTFPLEKLRKLEYEFYRFGGVCSSSEVVAQERKRGVDKRLVLIEPTEKGHLERSIIGSEIEVAKLLGVSLDLIRERERVSLRRDTSGRTGVYLKKQVPPDEGIEEWADRFIRKNPPASMKFRRKL
ncbi:MAG: nucleotidyltransferase domain-containing protein [Thermoproteota archaeon]